jgi:hypothetical protein
MKNKNNNNNKNKTTRKNKQVLLKHIFKIVQNVHVKVKV